MRQVSQSNGLLCFAVHVKCSTVGRTQQLAMSVDSLGKMMAPCGKSLLVKIRLFIQCNCLCVFTFGFTRMIDVT